MIAAPCPRRQRVTGHKSGPGVTFFAAVLTRGRWLLVIPLYSKRCVVCGTLASKVATTASRARYSAAVTPLVMGTLFAGILVARSKVAVKQGTPRGPAMGRAAAHTRSPGG